MARKTTRMRKVGREQLDRRLIELRQSAPSFRPPGKGWIASIRTALGMTQDDLAARMGISRQAVSQLEQREVDGSITLNALRQAAEALGSEVAYAVVPHQAIEKTLGERARSIARHMVTSVRHSMRLEDQEPSSDMESRINEIAQELLASPGTLWSHPDAK